MFLCVFVTPCFISFLRQRRSCFYLERLEKPLRFSECNFNELKLITQTIFLKA
jgi:hypothetical protein